MLSEEVFITLYQDSASDLRRYATRLTGSVAHADDVVQEAYLRLLRHPPNTTDIGDLRAYVFRIAGNLVADLHRSQRRTERFAPVEPEQAQHRILPREPEARLDMARTFRRLSLRDRQLMWLAYVEGESHRQIAAALGVREPSVRVLLSRARSRLRALLGAPGSKGRSEP